MADAPIDLTDGKQVESSQPFQLHLLQIWRIQHDDMADAPSPRPCKVNQVVTGVQRRWAFYQQRMLCRDGKHQIEHRKPPFPGSDIGIRVERPILAQEDPLSDDRERRMDRLKVVVDEFIRNVLGRASREVGTVESRDFRVILKVVQGGNGRTDGVLPGGCAAVLVEVALESVQPCNVRVLAHKPHRLYLFIAVEIFFGVVDRRQGVAPDPGISAGCRRTGLLEIERRELGDSFQVVAGEISL